MLQMDDFEKYGTAVPNYGLKLKLNHVYPVKCTPDFMPSVKQLWSLLVLIIRYIWYYLRYRWAGKLVVMDYFTTLSSKQIYGVPLGGIGCGTIGRGYRGEFCRFQMIPGIYVDEVVPANQFIVTVKNENKTIFHSLLSAFPMKKLKAWESLLDPANCFYTGLYPRSWTEYDLSRYGIMLTCRQISPVMPHNYKDTSLPCSIFVWDVKNISDEERTVTLAFTFKNGVGQKSIDQYSTCSSKAFDLESSQGIVLYNTINKLPCSYILAAKTRTDLKVSKCLYFDPNSDGSDVWSQLKDAGEFNLKSEKNIGQVYGEMGCGIAVKATVLPKTSCSMEMSLIWDMPVLSFLQTDKKFFRYYTKYFGTENAGLRIVKYAFDNYRNWERLIFEWQAKILDDSELPEWYKSALFNETYFVSDGGSLWLTVNDEEAKTMSKTDLRREFGKFALLEGHEYKMFNSYDVHFYASFVLSVNWPLLQLVIQYDIKDSIYAEIPEKVRMIYDNRLVERKKPNTVPHDVGDPANAPFKLVNAYPIHDVSVWRDLNSKFVLQVFRDVYSTPINDLSLTYLKDMYDACLTIMEKSETFDVDGDGLIENSGTPDQTFDTWTMYGSSAYCGGLWLAAVFAMIKFSETLKKDKDKERFENILFKGQRAFDRKLWNGQYYNFDCSKRQCKSIMADQLSGHWYLRCSGFNYEVFPQDRVKSCLSTIYENNVLLFCDGKRGAVNGFIDGGVDKITIQSEEVWMGVTYAVAANMIQEGMWKEGFDTAGGMYKTLTNEFGLAFDTPEALYDSRHFRSLSYLRPLSIWSMQVAIDQYRKNKSVL